MQFAQGMGCNRNGKQEEVNVVFNMNNKKTRKIFSTIVIVLVVLAMVVPMVLGSLLFFNRDGLKPQNLSGIRKISVRRKE